VTSEKCVIEDPVRIEQDVEVVHSKLGPNVSIGSGSRVVRSELRDCIVGRNAVIEGSVLHDSLIGSEVSVRGVTGRVLLGDHGGVWGESRR
jgi:glucose-1-phosphate thymidylyltransferase